jgi:hypothetical protein
MKKRNFSVVKHDELNDDLQTIVDYYNEQKPTLGNDFFFCVLKQMKQLKNDCFLYEVKYQNIRCVQVFGFPYLIHYKISEESKLVYILAIIGMKQDPDSNWGKRK